MEIREKAYAKINLVLNILSKREDGYHEVDFLMNSLDLFDDVVVSENNENIVEVENEPWLDGEKNLAFQAIILMQQKYGIKQNYKVIISKKIPVSAGMAGGSSDAAATLRAINKLSGLNKPLSELEEIAKQLGSDVPYCLYSKLARATGRGEQIELIEKEIPKLYVVVCNPSVPLSTGMVFKNHVIEDKHGSVDAMVNELNFKNIENNLFNNLQSTATKLCPQINIMIDKIKEYTNNRVLLSGSGPTVFVLFETEQEAKELSEKLLLNYSKVYVTKFR